jgi:gluconolactonase
MMRKKNETLANIVGPTSRLERLATGFQFTEGPVWNAAEEVMLFSDIPANRIYKWSAKEGVTVFRDPSHHANGLTYDRQGRLILCEHGARRIARLDTNGEYMVLADTFRGKRLNSPNDVVLTSDGAIYFTDPPYGITPQEQELPFQGVFRIDPASNELLLLVEDCDRPNGLAFTPDETRLYVADSSSRRHIRVFDVDHEGGLRNSRVFADVRGELEGNPDGMKMDVEGNLYVAAAGGVWVFSAAGVLRGVIETPEKPSNLAWFDEEWRSLFITARTSVFRIRLGVPGVPVPK